MRRDTFHEQREGTQSPRFSSIHRLLLCQSGQNLACGMLHVNGWCMRPHGMNYAGHGARMTLIVVGSWLSRKRGGKRIACARLKHSAVWK